MKEAIITDINGLYTGVVIVEDAITGVFPINQITPAVLDDEGVEITPETTELIGYQVAVKVSEGLYLPKFDLVNEEWGEGKTQAELDEIHSRVPPETLENKVVRLESENASLVSEAARLAARDAQMQDDQMFMMEALATAGLI